MSEKHCPSCICGRRAPVQGGDSRGPGTISWTEHLAVWSAYAAIYGSRQSAEQIAERAGFGFREATALLGKPLATWEPAR